MNAYLISVLAIVVSLTSLNAVANLQQDPENQQQSLANLAFQKALNKMHIRRKTLPENMGLAYVQTELDENGNGTQSRYQPINKQHGLWTELHRYGEPIDSNLNFETPLLIEPTSFSAEHAKLSSETDSTWVFLIPNLVNVGLGDDEVDEQQERELQLDNQLKSVLQTELVIDKKTQEFVSLHIFAKTPFKPSFLAKVEKFDVRVEFAEAWPEGPLIGLSTSRSMRGKYGFFVNIEEFKTTTISEVKKTSFNESS